MEVDFASNRKTRFRKKRELACEFSRPPAFFSNTTMNNKSSFTRLSTGSEACVMKLCKNPIGSTTSRWLAAANPLYSTSKPTSPDSSQAPDSSQPQDSSQTPGSSQAPDSSKLLFLLSRWKPYSTPGPKTLKDRSNPPFVSPKSEQKGSPPILVQKTNPDKHLPAESHGDSPASDTADHNPYHPRTPQPTPPKVRPIISYRPLHAVPSSEPAPTAAIEKTVPHPIFERPPLPISPLMDSDAIAAKEKWVARKSRPSKKPEDFQQMLAKNPYARALATPLRRCQLTNNALPSFFLQGFNLMAHPDTGIPLYVPRSLALAKKGEPQLLKEQPDLELERKEDMEQSSQSNKTPAEFTSALGYTIYILASQHILRAMQDPKGYGMIKRKKKKDRNGIEIPENAPPFRFIPDRYRQSKSTAKFLSAAGWRKDMHEFILRLMRRRMMENLVALTNLKRGYVVGCSGWEDALAKPQIGAFLWTGGAEELEEGTDSPPEFATLDVTIGRKEESKTKKIPVHNLRRLLGKDKLAELREALPSGIFKRDVVVLKHKQQAVDVEMQLWRLQGFLAEYRDLYRDLEELPTNQEDAEQDDYYEDENE